MEHQYIDNEDNQLYSVYHEPKNMENDNTGIILCYPLGQEYIRCHKLYVNLANNLSMQGFHVLRFDFSGTGDSFGDSKSTTIANCLKNIGLAIKEIKEACDVKKIILIGARFGATLAMLYSKKFKVDGVVAWNPIYKGNDYLLEISKVYRKWLNGSFTKEKKTKQNSIMSFGFAFSSVITKEIREVSLTKDNFNLSIPILLIDDKQKLIIENLSNVTFEPAINREFWIKGENEQEKSIVQVSEINSIVDWVKNIDSLS